MKMRLFALALATLALVTPSLGDCAPGSTSPHKAPTFSEPLIKAGFIYKFISFVSWPEAQSDDDTITIGILGENPFGDAFKSIEGKPVGDRVVKVKFFKKASDYKQLKICQVLYISSSEEKKLKNILKGMGHSSTLTVGDSKDFIDAGGMIGFVRKENEQIGIEVNDVAAGKADLTIRSMLKRIAVRIINKPDSSKE